MNNQLELSKFIAIGQHLERLMIPNHIEANYYSQSILKFIELLGECSLENTKASAKPLSKMTEFRYDRYKKTMYPDQATKFSATLNPIREALYAEVDKMQTISLDIGVVSQKLRDLDKILSFTESQKYLLDETVLCIEARAYRSGVVMGWNFAYDYIRQWVFDNYKQQFNEELTTRYLKKGGQSQYDSIGQYEDFFRGSPSEWIVIETCGSSNIIGKKVKENLCHFLRQRNNYAHASFRHPTPEQTISYIQHLIDLITDRPFPAAN